MTKRPSFLPLHWVLGAASFIGLCFMGSFLADGDTGVHIRIGQYMLEHRAFIREDLFSYFTPPVPWHNHEWLAQILMALLFTFAGLKGIVLFFCFLGAAVLSLLFKQMEAKSGTLTALFVFIFAFLNLYVHFLARPHLFTMLFVLLWKKVLDDFQAGKRNRLLILPLWMLLWVNLHGAFIMGMLLLGIYGVGNFFPAFFGGKAKKKELERSRLLVMTILACFFVTLFNPDGIYIWKYIFGFTSNPLLMDRISEFKSTDFHQFAPVLHFVYLTLVVMAASRSPLSLIEWILTAVFASMALYSERHLPLFTLVTAPILAAKLSEMLEPIPNPPALSKISRICSRARNGFRIFFAVGFAGAFLFILSPLKTYDYDAASKPVKAVEFMQKEKIPGRIFSSDEFGDYLIFKLWPETKVFIYGWFNDTGAMERFRDYLEMALVRPRWQETLNKHQINAVLSASDAPLTGALAAHPSWKLIYSDSTACLFIRVLPSNLPWIQQFSGTHLSDMKPL